MKPLPEPRRGEQNRGAPKRVIAQHAVELPPPPKRTGANGTTSLVACVSLSRSGAGARCSGPSAKFPAHTSSILETFQAEQPACVASENQMLRVLRNSSCEN